MRYRHLDNYIRNNKKLSLHSFVNKTTNNDVEWLLTPIITSRQLANIPVRSIQHGDSTGTAVKERISAFQQSNWVILEYPPSNPDPGDYRVFRAAISGMQHV
jgi:hypothetical protein